jgi:hypothetical protein
VNEVDPRFARTLGVRLLRGRSLDDPAHAGGAGIAVVTESLANRIDPMGPAVDTTIETAFFRGRVVGVIRDLVDTRPGVPPEPQIFHTPQRLPAGMVVIVRTRPPVESAEPAVRALLENRWGDLPPTRLHAMRDEWQEVLTPWRGRSVLLNLVAALCLPLAAIGISGALMYSVRTRRREHAIRLALGAAPADLRRLVIRQSALVVAAGLAMGGMIGGAAAYVMASVLFEVRSFDVPTLGSVVGGVLVVAWLATVVPARRAAGTDPAEALREG